MKCRDTRELIHSYLDNKTDPRKDPVLAEHIRSCPECRAELEFLLKYRKILSEIKPVSAPDNFMQELHRKLELEKNGSPFKKVFHNIKDTLYSFRFPLEAAGVIAVAVMVFLLYKPFFSDKAPLKTTDYAAHAPRKEIPGKKIKPEVESEVRKSAHRKSVPREKKVKSAMDNIIEDKVVRETIKSKQADLADESFSEKENDYELPALDIKMKSRSMVKKRSKKLSEEKLKVSENLDNKGISAMKKDADKADLPEAEKIFRELEVSVIQKDISHDGRIRYRVKVQTERYNLLIRKLKEKYSLQEKVINRQEKFYVIELFLANE